VIGGMRRRYGAGQAPTQRMLSRHVDYNQAARGLAIFGTSNFARFHAHLNIAASVVFDVARIWSGANPGHDRRTCGCNRDDMRHWIICLCRPGDKYRHKRKQTG
jgi:hypothetical protein